MIEMDDPVGHVNHRLLVASTFDRPNSNVPLRNRTDTFKHFNSNSGGVLTRGRDDHHFDNPRVFGEYFTLMIQQTKLFRFLTEKLRSSC